MGPEAQDHYATLKPEQKLLSIYFEHVKKHLQHEKVPYLCDYQYYALFPPPRAHSGARWRCKMSIIPMYGADLEIEGEGGAYI